MADRVRLLCKLWTTVPCIWMGSGIGGRLLFAARCFEEQGLEQDQDQVPVPGLEDCPLKSQDAVRKKTIKEQWTYEYFTEKYT